MFTGIIDHCGTILKIENIENGMKVWIKTLFPELEIGESVAINGVCLTVTEFKQKMFACDISPETLKLTAAKNFKMGELVNLERALQSHSRIGGHFVSGHVDQMAKVKSIRQLNEFTEIVFSELDKNSLNLIIKKGSITVNGVSLTINEVLEDEFNVMLIPHTLERTQLGQLRENDAVNIEFDMMARIIARQTEVYKVTA